MQSYNLLHMLMYMELVLVFSVSEDIIAGLNAPIRFYNFEKVLPDVLCDFGIFHVSFLIVPNP